MYYNKPFPILKLLIPVLFVLATLGGCASDNKAGGTPSGGTSTDSCKNGDITVTGEAPIFTSVDAANEKARESACRRAVEICIGTEVASRSEVGDGQALSNDVYAKAKGLCKNGNAVKYEDYTLDTIKMRRVYMRYQVSAEALESEIRLVQQMVGNPRIMIYLQESSAPDAKGCVDRGDSATPMLTDFFKRKGYSMIPEQKGVKVSLDNSGESLLQDPSLKSTMEKAASKGADVLILGKIRLESWKSPMANVVSCRATGEVSAIALWGRGSVLAEYTQSVSGAHFSASTAARAAIERFTIGSSTQEGGLALFLHDRFSNEWANLTRSNEIVLHVKGLTPEMAGVFRDDLTERTSVRRINEVSSNVHETVWEVIYPGRSFALADIITFYGSNPSMFTVVGKSGKKIQVDTVRRGEIYLTFK